MVKNRAIIIGINQYHFMQPLKYAKRDAELFFDFLSQLNRSEQTYCESYVSSLNSYLTALQKKVIASGFSLVAMEFAMVIETI
jgi:hypothetical protein